LRSGERGLLARGAPQLAVHKFRRQAPTVAGKLPARPGEREANAE